MKRKGSPKGRPPLFILYIIYYIIYILYLYILYSILLYILYSILYIIYILYIILYIFYIIYLLFIYTIYYIYIYIYTYTLLPNRRKYVIGALPGPLLERQSRIFSCRASLTSFHTSYILFDCLLGTGF